MPAHEVADQVDLTLVEAHPLGDVTGERFARDAVLGELALADVVQQRRHHQHVGPGHPTDQRGRLDAGLHHVPVDGEPVHHRGVRQQPHPFPLGQDLLQRPGLVERLPHAEQPGPGRQQTHQQLSGAVGPGIREWLALADQACRRGRGQQQVPLGRLGGRAQEKQRVGGRVGAPVEDDLLVGHRDAGRDRLQPGAALAGRVRTSLHRLGTTPRQAAQVGDPPGEPAGVHLHGRPVGQAEELRHVGPVLRDHAVGGTSGHGVQGVADVEQRHPAPLQVAVRYVDEPAGDQCLERRRVAQAAHRVLEVRDGGVRELTGQPTALGDHLAQLLEPGAGVATPLVRHGGPHPQGEVRVTREVPGVEHPGRHAQVGGRLLQHLLDRAHRVVDVGAGVPERVPDLAGPRTDLDVGVVDQHHVEVAERRQLLPAVATDRDQGDTRVRAARRLERLGAELVGDAGALGPLGCGHALVPVMTLRWPTGRGPRCGRGRRCRPARPRPCRPRSCPSGRPRRSPR